MASKGQKFNKYSLDFKTMILKEYFDGCINQHALAKKYDVNIKTIVSWLHNYKNGKLGTKRGRPKSRKLTLEDYKERYEILKKYQAFLQARQEKK